MKRSANMDINGFSDGKVLYARQRDVHWLHYMGQIRYPLAPSVERFVDRLFRGLDQPAFVIDLNETESIDSTNLGLIARIANRVSQCGGPRVTITSRRKDINELLEGMAFDELFDIVEGNGWSPERGELVPLEESTLATMQDTILEAHRTLVALAENNRERFAEVVAALEREELDDW
jgi:anti-anti-sigma factor